MANGKIQYTPYPSRAISLDSSYYLSLTESENLVTMNPGFELGSLTGWTAGKLGFYGSDVSIVSGSAYEGTYNIKVMGQSGFYYNQTFNLERGKKYKFGFAAKWDTSDVTLVVALYDENDILIFQVDTDSGLSTNWKMYWSNFTPGRNYYNCRVEVSIGGVLTHYVEMDNFLLQVEYLDFGTESFTIDALIYPFELDGYKTLACKYDYGVPSTGWHLYYYTDYKYHLSLLDGTNSITINSDVVSQLQTNAYHWVRVVVDRTNDLAHFYVNGESAGINKDISSITGSVTVADELRLFGINGSANLLNGWCDFIRFQRGTALSSTWMADEWSRIQYGRIRTTISNTAIWEFNDSLADEVNGLTLTVSDSSTHSYADGWPYADGTVSYTFSLNYTYSFKVTPLGGGGLVRANLTGSAYNRPGPRGKFAYVLSFDAIDMDQYNVLLAAWEGGEAIDLWLDADKEQTDTVYFDSDNSPGLSAIPYFGDDGKNLYQVEMDLVSI